MSEYGLIATSAEVWAAIKAKHHADLVVFSSFSDPDGRAFGGAGLNGKMKTSYGFKGAVCPLMEARSTWEIDHEQPYKRMNESHEYWLCFPTGDEE